MDEGLLGDTANRIASGESIPFLEGMVSYTTWICSYVPAVLFKWLGVNQVVYRMSGVIEVVLGVLLISLALFLVNQKKTAIILPGVIAFFPALVINQRWVVEACTFFVLCAGIAALGLSLKYRGKFPWLSSFLVIVGTCAGIHSHIVFLAPVISLYLCLITSGKITRLEDRLTVLCICVLQIPFFLKIGKLERSAELQSIFLISADIAIILFTLFPQFLNRILPLLLREKLLMVPTALGCILFVPFLLFMEGHWLVMFSVGFIDYSFLIGLTFIPFGIVLFDLLKSRWRLRSLPLSSFLPVAIFLVYAMVIKAGPRYFEVMFLYVAVALAWAMSRMKQKKAILVGILWVTQGSLILGLNYFKPSVEERQIDKIFYFWRWRDGSGGFLPKAHLLKRLADEGCSYLNIDFRERDDNTHGAFRILKINDWPPFVPPCRLGNRIKIRSRSDFDSPEPSRPGRVVEGPYWIIDTTNDL